MTNIGGCCSPNDGGRNERLQTLIKQIIQLCRNSGVTSREFAEAMTKVDLALFPDRPDLDSTHHRSPPYFPPIDPFDINLPKKY